MQRVRHPTTIRCAYVAHSDLGRGKHSLTNVCFILLQVVSARCTAPSKNLRATSHITARSATSSTCSKARAPSASKSHLPRTPVISSSQHNSRRHRVLIKVPLASFVFLILIENVLKGLWSSFWRLNCYCCYNYTVITQAEAIDIWTACTCMQDDVHVQYHTYDSCTRMSTIHDTTTQDCILFFIIQLPERLRAVPLAPVADRVWRGRRRRLLPAFVDGSVAGPRVSAAEIRDAPTSDTRCTSCLLETEISIKLLLCLWRVQLIVMFRRWRLPLQRHLSAQRHRRTVHLSEAPRTGTDFFQRRQFNGSRWNTWEAVSILQVCAMSVCSCVSAALDIFQSVQRVRRLSRFVEAHLSAGGRHLHAGGLQRAHLPLENEVHLPRRHCRWGTEEMSALNQLQCVGFAADDFLDSLQCYQTAVLEEQQFSKCDSRFSDSEERLNKSTAYKFYCEESAKNTQHIKKWVYHWVIFAKFLANLCRFSQVDHETGRLLSRSFAKPMFEPASWRSDARPHWAGHSRSSIPPTGLQTSLWRA